MLLAAMLFALAGEGARAEDTAFGFADTPILPGTPWHVHDGERPQPPVMTPGAFGTHQSPSDALVLFDGANLDHWQALGGGAAPWRIEGGAMVAAGGTIETKAVFGDCQLHLEWCAPVPPRGDGQHRGNSGVIFFGRYEVQVLDSFDNPTYPDGQAGAIYGTYPPLANAMRPTGEWQTYDILFTAPRFEAGAMKSPAYITVIHNGVLVQNHVEVLGTSKYRELPSYEAHPPKGSIHLQDHGDPVRYRNVWIRELNG